MNNTNLTAREIVYIETLTKATAISLYRFTGRLLDFADIAHELAVYNVLLYDSWAESEKNKNAAMPGKHNGA